MKILVYGCGVNGSLLVHTLCKAGNEVTVVDRGAWGEVLHDEGLRIQHHLQHRYTVDHPKVVEELPEDHYDMVFSDMQGHQQKNILPVLAKVDSPIVVLVGNNLEAAEMDQKLQELSGFEKKVYFGFQNGGGSRSDKSVVSLHSGEGTMTVGGLHCSMSKADQKLLKQAFDKTAYKLIFERDMEGWLYCHAAFILPLAYVIYRYECNLRHLSFKELDKVIQAIKEAYGLFKISGIKIRPDEDVEYFQPGLKRLELKLTMMMIGRTKIGNLAVLEHCRNAVAEMEWLDRVFEKLRRKNPGYPMPDWEDLRRIMPTWDELHLLYDMDK